MENNVTVTLSAYNVKIIKDDRAGVSKNNNHTKLISTYNSNSINDLMPLHSEHLASHPNPRDSSSELRQ